VEEKIGIHVEIYYLCDLDDSAEHLFVPRTVQVVLVVKFILVGRDVSAGIEIDFSQRNDLATFKDLVSSIGQDEWSDTNVIDKEGGNIPFRIEGTVTLGENNQDCQDDSKDRGEWVPQSAVWQFVQVTALSNISLTETNVGSSNTSPTDETSNSSDTQEPDESIIGAIDTDKDARKSNNG